MRRDGADDNVIHTYDLLITDLHAERTRSIVYGNYFSEQFRNVVGGDNTISTSEDNKQTDSNNDSGTL